MSAPSQQEKIAICVCTYRRPELLAELLESIFAQKLNEEVALDLRIVIVDNDDAASAREAVSQIAAKTEVPIQYIHEPVKNISIARNAAISHARTYFPDWILMLDDDEVLGSESLQAFISHVRQSNNRIFVGCHWYVLPDKMPIWAKSLKIYQSNRLPDLRTGVLLIAPSVFDEIGMFNPDFGLTGGEDTEFFVRCKKRNLIIEKAPKANVSENVREDRIKFSWHVIRNFRVGTTNAKIYKMHNPLNIVTLILLITVHLCKIVVRLLLGVLYLFVFQVSSATEQLFLLISYIGYLVGLTGYAHKEYR